MRRFKNRKGFSLIELLIVIAIIGIIATIAIPILLSARNNAINEKARNSLRTVVSAQAAYYSEVGYYSADFQTLYTGGYLDARFNVAGDADLGQNITVTLTIGTTNQEYDATASGATHTYAADETGEVRQTS